MRPKRTLRFNSHSPGHTEAGWAVSYADFLMVLLSFFIVFFSFDEKSALHNIVVSLNNNAPTAAAGAGAGNGSGSGAGGGLLNAEKTDTVEKFDTEVLSKVAGVFKLNKTETSVTKERVVVDLPADVYRLGSYTVPRAQLDSVLKALIPYQGEISITVMGYSDSNAFPDGAKKRVVKDNLTLSSMRAAYASNYIQQILPQTQVLIQASEEGKRQTRSLSLVIEARKGGKK
jgi:flagellar motor protein MotB